MNDTVGKNITSKEVDTSPAKGKPWQIPERLFWVCVVCAATFGYSAYEISNNFGAGIATFTAVFTFCTLIVEGLNLMISHMEALHVAVRDNLKTPEEF